MYFCKLRLIPGVCTSSGMRVELKSEVGEDSKRELFSPLLANHMFLHVSVRHVVQSSTLSFGGMGKTTVCALKTQQFIQGLCCPFINQAQLVDNFAYRKRME